MLQLPLVFVVLSLVALVVVPVLVQRRISALQEEINETGQSARTRVSEVQYTLAREMSLLRGFLITGDAEFLQAYQATLLQEHRAFEELQPLARQLAPEASERFGELRSLAVRWHQDVSDEEVLRGLGVSGRSAQSVLLEQQMYEEALDAATRLDQAIVRATAARARRVRELEHLELALTTALALLALVSACVVAWLVNRVRVFSEEAQHRRQEAEEAMEAKARLIRGVTHDLKNPLGAVDGYAEILEMGIKGDLSPEQRRIIGRMRGAVRSVLNAVTDLLEFSRAEAGLLTIARESTDFAALVAEAVEDYRAAAEAAGLRLEVSISDSLPIVHADVRRVRQILENLFSNAVKYTPEGGCVSVRAEVRTGGPGVRPGRWLVVEVSDTGPGILPEERERVFEEFVRLASTPTRQGGSGVGLAISRSMARLMKGEITLDGEVGRGSTFTLWLPLRAGD